MHYIIVVVISITISCQNSQESPPPTSPRADSRFARSYWDTALLCNDVSRWLVASRESALSPPFPRSLHYDDVIMDAIASQITSLASVYSDVELGAHQRKHQSSASLAFVWGIHRRPVNSPHKWPVTRKMFPFDDVIMNITNTHRVTTTNTQRHHISHNVLTLPHTQSPMPLSSTESRSPVTTAGHRNCITPTNAD